MLPIRSGDPLPMVNDASCGLHAPYHKSVRLAPTSGPCKELGQTTSDPTLLPSDLCACNVGASATTAPMPASDLEASSHAAAQTAVAPSGAHSTL